jgi:hypothetical protein
MPWRGDRAHGSETAFVLVMKLTFAELVLWIKYFTKQGT